MKNQKKSKNIFNFRRYKKTEGGEIKKAKHPKLIVDETNIEFGFMGLTESAKRGHHKNIALTKNPKQGDTRKAYIRDELRYDNKKEFSDILPEYKLTSQDIKIIEERVKKHKKKK